MSAMSMFTAAFRSRCSSLASTRQRHSDTALIPCQGLDDMCCLWFVGVTVVSRSSVCLSSVNTRHVIRNSCTARRKADPADMCAAGLFALMCGIFLPFAPTAAL
jgi:hypothetical protein